MSKIALSAIVYATFLSKTTIKTNKKQMISSADTFFWMTRYIVASRNKRLYAPFLVLFKLLNTPSWARQTLRDLTFSYLTLVSSPIYFLPSLPPSNLPCGLSTEHPSEGQLGPIRDSILTLDLTSFWWKYSIKITKDRPQGCKDWGDRPVGLNKRK